MPIFQDCGCGCNGKEQQKKFIRALVLGVLFFIVANPRTFQLVRKVLGYRIASATGYPTLLGLIVHALVFFLVSWGLMNLKGREKLEGWATSTSNTSPDSISDMTNWSPTDSMDGKPPTSSPGGPAQPPSTLPAMEAMEQPFASVTMKGMDINAPTWQTCSLANGKQVLVQN